MIVKPAAYANLNCYICDYWVESNCWKYAEDCVWYFWRCFQSCRGFFGVWVSFLGWIGQREWHPGGCRLWCFDCYLLTGGYCYCCGYDYYYFDCQKYYNDYWNSQLRGWMTIRHDIDHGHYYYISFDEMMEKFLLFLKTYLNSALLLLSFSKNPLAIFFESEFLGLSFSPSTV